jgi:hypothetical protein
MSVSYAIRNEVNFQTVIWAIAGAIYQAAKGVQRAAGYLPTLATLLAILQVAGMTLAATAVIATGLFVTMTWPALVVCGFVLGCVAYVSMPR